MDMGRAVRLCRDSYGHTQRAAAGHLRISNVHLCEIEKGRKGAGKRLRDRIRQCWGVDIEIVAWLLDPPAEDQTTTMEKFRRSYFCNHGINLPD